jgi:hypothetical protein
MRARIKRSIEIEMTYYDEQMRLKKGTYGGFIA